MNKSLENSLFHLTGHNDIRSVDVEQLEQLVSEHPYFPVAHVLLSTKLKSENDEKFLTQVQKTALYFCNPYWMHYQLMDIVPEIRVIKDDKKNQQQAAINDNQKEEKVSLPSSVSQSELVKARNLASQTLALHESNIIDTGVGAVATKETIDQQSQHPETPHYVSEEDSSSNTKKEIDDDEDIQILPDQFHPEEEIIQEELEAEEPVNLTQEEEPADATPNGDNKVNATEVIADPSNDMLGEPVSAVSVSEEELIEDEKILEEIQDHSSGEAQAQIDQNLAEDLYDKQTSSNILEQQIAKALDDHENFAKGLAERQKSGGTNAGGEPLIPIEPYHTIDYFASQGIKLSLDKNPKDRLGRQLRSFTDWLKHMKKLGPEDALESMKDTHLESTIQGIADTSNIPRDIVTETMAEVLEKQGKKDKAIQLYIKLSFLNPDKSAFFADKIQKLKGI